MFRGVQLSGTLCTSQLGTQEPDFRQDYSGQDSPRNLNYAQEANKYEDTMATLRCSSQQITSYFELEFYYSFVSELAG